MCVCVCVCACVCVCVCMFLYVYLCGCGCISTLPTSVHVCLREYSGHVCPLSVWECELLFCSFVCVCVCKFGFHFHNPSEKILFIKCGLFSHFGFQYCSSVFLLKFFLALLSEIEGQKFPEIKSKICSTSFDCSTFFSITEKYPIGKRSKRREKLCHLTFLGKQSKFKLKMFCNPLWYGFKTTKHQNFNDDLKQKRIDSLKNDFFTKCLQRSLPPSTTFFLSIAFTHLKWFFCPNRNHSYISEDVNQIWSRLTRATN